MTIGNNERARSRQAEREVRQNSPLRQARHCYDHLAGVAGVQLFDALVARAWIVVEPPEPGRLRSGCRLTAEGRVGLSSRGVDLTTALNRRRRFAYTCVDWTERRPHLGGALGAALLAALEQAGVVQRSPQSRVLTLRQPLELWLGTQPAENPPSLVL